MSNFGPYMTLVGAEIALRAPDCDHRVNIHVADVLEGRILVAQHGDDPPYEQALDTALLMRDDREAVETAVGFARAVGNYVLGLHSSSEFGGSDGGRSIGRAGGPGANADND